MSSSTSSSDAAVGFQRPIPGGPWGRTLALAAVLFVVAVAAMERAWRHRGLVPTVDDSLELWSSERDRVYPGWRKKLVLVGGSRLLCDADMDVLARRLPGYDVVQLSVLGKTPVATLRDLADDEGVRDASIVVDVAEHALERVNWPDQDGWVAHARGRKNLAADFEIRASAWLKAHLVVVNPIVGFANLAAGHTPKRDYVTYGADRSCRSDYSLVDAAKARAARTERVRTVYGQSKPSSPEAWLAQAREVDAMAQRLVARGSKVTFLRPPTTGDHWLLDEQRYPPPLYWDAFEKVATVPAIHFKEEPGMGGFDAPDGSHLDVKDIGMFTECLVDALQRRRIVEVPASAPASGCEATLVPARVPSGP